MKNMDELWTRVRMALLITVSSEFTFRKICSTYGIMVVCESLQS